MDTQKQETINKHIQKLGFDDIYVYALEQLILSNEKELEENNEAIKAFEQKYGMDFTSFDKQFHDIEGDHFEKEDDSMEWEVRLDMRNAQEKALNELKILKNKEEDDEA